MGLFILGLAIVAIIWFVKSSGSRSTPAMPSPVPAALSREGLALKIMVSNLERSGYDRELIIDRDDDGLRQIAEDAFQELGDAERALALGTSLNTSHLHAALRMLRAESVQHAIRTLLEAAVELDVPVPPRIATSRTLADFALLTGSDYYDFKHEVMRATVKHGG